MGRPLNPELHDPLHSISPPTTSWSTRNVAEAMPGVPTPLSWSLWGPAMELATWELFRRVGAFSRSQLRGLQRDGARPAALFYGHCAGNVDLYSEALAHLGADPQGFQRQMFGIEPSTAPQRSFRRVPVLLAKAPALLIRHRRELERLRCETEAWWRDSLDGRLEARQARTRLAEVAQRFQQAMRIQITQTLLSQAAFDLVGKAAERAGHPGLENSLVSASADLDEVVLAADLWEVAKGRLSEDAFLARHGYHGPNEGELSTRSWREDPRPVQAAAARYAGRDDQESPSACVARQRCNQARSLAALGAATTGTRRRWTRRIVSLACVQVPRREIGKSAILRVLDVGRHAARRIGEELVQRDQLDAPDDIFYLTLDEILDDPLVDWRPAVLFRKSRRADYLRIELPDHWIGDPIPAAATGEAPEPIAVIRGIAASPGKAKGRARVVLDALDCTEPLGPDEILVTSTTDPGWVAMFMGAGGMIIDIGGPMSHAAIVARALGVPCVINTVNGTRRIADGAPVHIDGDRGTIELVDSGASDLPSGS